LVQELLADGKKILFETEDLSKVSFVNTDIARVRFSQITKYMNKVKPEAAYFLPLDGDRAMAFILNIDNNYEVPSLVEPLFQRMGAKVEVIPVMNFDDLKKGISESR
jgi:hypothetical protein